MPKNTYQKLGGLREKNSKWLAEGELFGSRVDNYFGAQLFARYIFEKKKANRDVLPAATPQNRLCREFLSYVEGKAEEGKGNYEEVASKARQMLDRGEMNDATLVEVAEVFDDLNIGERESEIANRYENALSNIRPETAPVREEEAAQAARPTFEPAPLAQGEAAPPKERAPEITRKKEIIPGAPGEAPEAVAPKAPEERAPEIAGRPPAAPVEEEAAAAAPAEAPSVSPVPTPTPTPAPKVEAEEVPAAPKKTTEELELEPLIAAPAPTKKKVVEEVRVALPEERKFVEPTTVGRIRVKREKKVKREEVAAEEVPAIPPARVAPPIPPAPGIAPRRRKSAGARIAKRMAGAAVGGGALLSWLTPDAAAATLEAIKSLL